jgi:hypothetical protein
VNFKRTAALLASTSLISLAGCGHAGVPGAATTGMQAANAFSAASHRARTAKGGKWTMLLHIAANNNLYDFAFINLNEMEAALPADGSVEIYAEFKGTQDGDACVYHIKRDPAGNNKAVISEKLYPADVIPANHNIDSGDANQLIKFIQWGVKTAPADHYLVDVWDHGSGLFGGKAPNPITKGFGWDDTTGNNMHTWDLPRITGAFKAAAGKNLDIFGFDCCLMSHSELAYELAGTTDFLAASEEVEPGAGWDYKGWLDAVAKGDHTPLAVASALTDTYVASYQPGGAHSSGGSDNATFATTDINAYMANVAPAMTTFVTAAEASMAKNKTAYQQARQKAQHFYNSDCADIGNFLSILKVADPAVTAAQGKLAAAYKTAIVREGHTKGMPGATGNVVYFPAPGDTINPVYTDASKILFAKENWKDFLKAYIK